MCFTGLLLTFALAQTPSQGNWGLTWNAPDGCIRTAQLAERIEQHFQRALFGTQPQLRIEGYAARVDTGWRARLTLLDSNGTVLGSREFATPEPDCRKLDERLVLASALMIQPVTPGLEPPPPPPPVSPPVVTPHRVPELIVTDDGRHLDDGRRIDLQMFYGLARRGDLVESLHARRTARTTTLVVGIVGLVAGVAVLVGGLLGLDCRAWSGSPASPGSCTKTSTPVIAGGGISASVGLVLTLVGALINPSPTSLAEDRELAAGVNAQRLSGR